MSLLTTIKLNIAYFFLSPFLRTYLKKWSHPKICKHGPINSQFTKGPCFQILGWLDFVMYVLKKNNFRYRRIYGVISTLKKIFRLVLQNFLIYGLPWLESMLSHDAGILIRDRNWTFSPLWCAFIVRGQKSMTNMISPRQ